MFGLLPITRLQCVCVNKRINTQVFWPEKSQGGISQVLFFLYSKCVSVLFPPSFKRYPLRTQQQSVLSISPLAFFSYLCVFSLFGPLIFTLSILPSICLDFICFVLSLFLFFYLTHNTLSIVQYAFLIVHIMMLPCLMMLPIMSTWWSNKQNVFINRFEQFGCPWSISVAIKYRYSIL